jgi:hypothetical protein
MKIISREQHYLGYSFYVIACQAQAQVREHERLLLKVLGDGEINDAIYNPLFKGTKEEYDDFLLKMGIETDWNKKEKDKKENLKTEEAGNKTQHDKKNA